MGSFIKMSQYDSDSATTSGAQSVFSQGGSFSIFQPEPRKFSWMALAMLGVMLSLIVALFIQVIKLITERENIEEKIAHLEEIVIEPKRPKVVILGDDSSSIVIRPPHPRDYEQNVVVTPGGVESL